MGKEPKRKLTVRVDLEGEILDKFEALQKRYGVKSAAEVVRILITQAYENFQKLT